MALCVPPRRRIHLVPMTARRGQRRTPTGVIAMTATRRSGPPLWMLVCVLAFGTSIAASPRGDDKPKKGEPNKEEGKKETPKKPPIHDSSADARIQLENAVAKAKRDHSRVLVMFGF